MKLVALSIFVQILLASNQQIGGWRTKEKEAFSSLTPTPVEVYNKVLDLVFVREDGNFKDRMKESSLTLRYKPSFASESQITITTFKDQRLAEAVVWTIPEGNRSIWDQVNVALNKNSKSSHQSISQEIKVEKRVIANSDKLNTLLRQFASLRIPSNLSSSIILDGYKFEVWFETVSSRYYFSLTSDREEEDNQNHPLIEWMIKVKNELAK